MRIQNGILMTMEGTPIPCGYVDFAEGKITGCGAMEDAPAYSGEILDAKGGYILPGFIDAHTHIGISEEGLRWEGEDCNETTGAVTADMRVTDGFNPFDTAIAKARRAGVTGMVSGQVMDVTGEGEPPTREKVEYIHAHKTADLLTAPIEAGLLLAGAGDASVVAGCAYGLHLGLAFQMVDDLLDVEGDTALLGKTVGKDVQEGKMTWVAVHGVDQTRRDAREQVEMAVAALEQVEGDTNFLKTLAQRTLNRVQ